MRITVLGSAAGGGFPQWNCNCRNCAGLRAGTLNAKARTQSSIFVRPDDGVDGVLFNASPDILEQIRSKPALQPARALRDTAIAGVVLMDGQIDHATGLFMLRERSTPLPLWCTDPVEEDLSQGNPVLRVLGALLRRAAPSHRAGRRLVRGGRRCRPDVSRAAPVEQGRALFAAPRSAGAGRQHRHADHRRPQRHERVLRARARPDHAAGVRRDGRRRRGAGRRHVLDR